jgi:quercetin dioxygenase-like cupin family protein
MTAEQTEQQRIFNYRDYIREGVERTLTRTSTDEDLTTIVEWVEPGREFEPPHWHPEAAHVFVFMEGEGEALLGKGRWQKVGPGDYLVCARNKVHAIRNTSATDRLVWVCVHVTHGLPYVVNQVDENHE